MDGGGWWFMMMDDTKEKERENKEEEDKKKSRAIFIKDLSLISQNNQSNIIMIIPIE